MTEFKFYPKSVVWEVTFACNMRCLHCGTAAGKKRPDELSTEEALNLIDELATLGTEEITLSGGEPLMRTDWRELAKRIREKGIEAAIISNGYLVTEEIVDDFVRLGFNDAGVSFDGTKETHNYIRQREDSWQGAYNALKLLADNGNQFFCAVTQVSNINLGELHEIKNLLVNVGCKVWRIQLCTATGRMQEHRNLVLTLDNLPMLIDTMLEIKEEGKILLDVGENIGYYGCKGYKLWDDMPYFGCYAGTRIAGIESNGTVKGCLSMPEDFVEGNIRDSSFTEIWNNPDGFAYNRKFTRESAEGICHDCKYLPLCRGGCTTTSFSASGCVANNPYCIYRMDVEEGAPLPEDTELVTSLLSRFETVEAK
ncbi:MAG: radical SAM protein [Candidatus Zixiibacteriota bacterium]|nr:MAG: radical SAM protein [candidate division Zixibacteria bacterium]